MAKKARTPVRLEPLEAVPYTVNGVTVSRANVDCDPLNIDVRTYIRIHSILERIENGSTFDGELLSIREEIAALALIERLRPKDTTINAIAGSSVRKYEDAFKGAPQRKTLARSSGAESEPDGDWFDQAGGDGGNGADEHDR